MYVKPLAPCQVINTHSIYVGFKLLITTFIAFLTITCINSFKLSCGKCFNERAILLSKLD